MQLFWLKEVLNHTQVEGTLASVLLVRNVSFIYLFGRAILSRKMTSFLNFMHVVNHTLKGNQGDVEVKEEEAGDMEVKEEEALEKKVDSHVRILSRRLILL